MSVETPDLVLIDGPNLYNSVGQHLANKVNVDSDLSDYFANWFDFDRFALCTLGTRVAPKLGFVVFHSNKRLGRSKYHLDQAEAAAFWGRQAGNPSTSCMVVDIPRAQKEKYKHKCEKCQHENEVTTKGEKGVDTSMVVYMFESFDRWESLCLFSRDVDFVPAVWALRRRGKQVLVAGEPSDSATALGRASQHFHPLNLDWLAEDLLAYRVLRRDGPLDEVVRNFRDDRSKNLRCIREDNRLMLIADNMGGGMKEFMQKQFEAVEHPEGVQTALVDLSVSNTSNVAVALRFTPWHVRPAESMEHPPAWIDLVPHY